MLWPGGNFNDAPDERLIFSELNKLRPVIIDVGLDYSNAFNQSLDCVIINLAINDGSFINYVNTYLKGCLITEAVKKVNPVATEEVVKTWMGKWLQQAKSRLDRK